MPAIKYIVDLTDEEREQLLQLLRKGKSAARKLTRARILLKAEEQVAQALHVGSATLGRVRQRFVEEGLESALNERPWPGQRRKLSGKQEAHLIAVACSSPPQGHGRWSLRLLAGKVVELGLANSISPETVRKLLKKQSLSPGRKSNGASRRYVRSSLHGGCAGAS
jgi:transposase